MLQKNKMVLGHQNYTNRVYKFNIFLLCLGYMVLVASIDTKPLKVYLDKALKHNPTIKAQFHNQQGSKELAHKESIFVSNPSLSVGYNSVPLVSFPSLNSHAMSGVNISVSQKLAFPWESNFRKKTMFKLYLSEQEKSKDLEKQIRQSVTKLYHNLYFYYRKVQLLKEQKKALEDIVKVARALVSVNKMHSSQLLKIDADISLIENSILEADGNAKKSEVALENVCGTSLDFSDTDTSHWLVKSSELVIPMHFKVQDHSYYKTTSFILQASEAQESHEKAKLFSDITLSGSYTMRQEIVGQSLGEDFVSFKVSAPLPLFYPLKERHAISASQEKVKSVRQSLRKVQLLLDSTWQGEIKMAKNLHLAYSNFEIEVIPKYLAAYRAQLGSLPSGTVSLLDVLDSYRMYLGAAIQEIKLYKDLRYSIANLEYLSQTKSQEGIKK